MTTENEREIEVRGQDSEEAIEAGLKQLGLGRQDVIVDIVDEGSRGLLGIGSREAVVRLTALVSPKPAPKRSPTPPATPKKAAAERIEADPEELELAVEILTKLLEQMNVTATIEVSLSEPDDLTGRQLNILEIHGDDLGVLIGNRGETLNAIQYVTRLMVGHRLRSRAFFIVDVEGYRERRQLALARLAERMANKVIKRRRPVSLEPMPPHERRIIHMTLRDFESVYTQSSGEGKRRKVRILPK